jgi:hypothetical protein
MVDACRAGLAKEIRRHFGATLESAPNEFAITPWGWYRTDLPEQAQSVPVDPLFNEFAIDNSAEELSIYKH